MSHSTKKYPFVKDVNSSKWGRKICNKKIRRKKDIPSGSIYKKMTQKYDYIYDYRFSETWKEYQNRCKNRNWTEEPPDYYEWFRMYKGK